jgi:hypothetical protein
MSMPATKARPVSMVRLLLPVPMVSVPEPFLVMVPPPVSVPVSMRIEPPEPPAAYVVPFPPAEVIVPALQIYTSILKWSGAGLIEVPRIGLADGLIRELYYQ